MKRYSWLTSFLLLNKVEAMVWILANYAWVCLAFYRGEFCGMPVAGWLAYSLLGWLVAVLMLAYAWIAMTEFVEVIIDIESNTRRTNSAEKPKLGSASEFLPKII